MFSLNLNGTLVLTMFKKSYFPERGSPPITAFMAVPLTSQHPLEKAHVVASSSSPITNNIQDHGAYKHKILELFLDIQFFPDKMLKTTIYQL